MRELDLEEGEWTVYEKDWDARRGVRALERARRGVLRIVVAVRAPRIAPVVYALEVAGGKPIRIERDGVIVAAADDYSVSGLFALLRQDLRWTAIEHVGDTPAVDLRALFEPETGRLVRYRRTVGTTKRRVLFIEVLAYEPLATPCLSSSS